MDSVAYCYNVCNVSSLKTEYFSFYLTVLLGLDKNLAHKRCIGVLLSYKRVSCLGLVAIWKYNSLDDLNKIHLGLTIPADPMSVENLLPGLQVTGFSMCHHMADCREREQVLSSA